MFNFRLTPLEHVHAWGGDNRRHLDWFALTDGCYWLRVGEHELFRATPQIFDLAEIESNCGFYVDYFVSRLWEDVQEILPAVLNPVPQPLCAKLSASALMAWYEKIGSWYENNEETTFEFDVNATEWLRKRRLHTAYLRSAPRIWLWSDEMDVHIEWDNREILEKNELVWEAQLGSWSLPKIDFLQEVRDFHQKLMQAMQSRIENDLPAWDHPDIEIDQTALIQAQVERQGWFDQALEKKPDDDWDGILKVAAIIEFAR